VRLLCHRRLMCDSATHLLLPSDPISRHRFQRAKQQRESAETRERTDSDIRIGYRDTEKKRIERRYGLRMNSGAARRAAADEHPVGVLIDLNRIDVR
jgi:hypothetical protein